MPSLTLTQRPKRSSTSSSSARTQSPVPPPTPRIQKPRTSPRLANTKKVRRTTLYDAHTIHRSITTTTTTIRKPATSTFVNDSASDTDMSEAEETVSEELIILSTDNIHFTLSDELDRRESYDSRYSGGNSLYEMDDFVVGDDDEDTVSECGSEITVTPETERGRKVSIETSRTWSSSSGEGLFVSDRNDRVVESGEWNGSAFRIMEQGVEAADVAEEIMDAVCRFSRRCNRDNAPLRIFLSGEMAGDGEVSEAVEYAIKSGTGRCEDAEGGVVVSIGPVNK
jgi:hypothetical protein